VCVYKLRNKPERSFFTDDGLLGRRGLHARLSKQTFFTASLNLFFKASLFSFTEGGLEEGGMWRKEGRVNLANM